MDNVSMLYESDMFSMNRFVRDKKIKAYPSDIMRIEKP